MFVGLNQFHRLTEKQLEGMYRKHYHNALFNTFRLSGLNIKFVKAKGYYLWDQEGNLYLDCMSSYGALNLGHHPSQIYKRIEEFREFPNFLKQSMNPFNGILANNLSHLTGHKLSICHLTNTGAESVEEAIKLAQFYKGKGKIIYCRNGYHGKSLGALSALGDKSKKKYDYLKSSFIEVPFGDYEAFRRQVNRHKVIAFLVEPIQGAGGIQLAPEGYFTKIHKLCKKKDILLIFDEVKTALGRCGHMFCYQEFGIVPDILCLAKSLSGGIMPIGAILTKERIWKKTYDQLKNATLLETTFGGNTLACIAAIEALTIIKEHHLADRSKAIGEYALIRLKKLQEKYPKLITDVRGKGLMIGIEFGSLRKMPTKMVKTFMLSHFLSELLHKHHILCGLAQNQPFVLLFEPPLIIDKGHVDRFVDALDHVLSIEKDLIRTAFHTIESMKDRLLV